MPRARVAALVLIASAVVAGRGYAQEKDSTTPPALGGPKVQRGAPNSDDRTLVHKEFDGRLKRLEVEPVGAAVAIMELNLEERAAAEKVLIERKTAFDALLRDNIPLVLKLQGAFKPGDNGEGQKALQQLFQKAKPVIDKGPLLEQVAAVLPKDKAAELRKIHAEYMAAAVQDRMDTGPADKKNDRFGARLAEGFANFQHEVESSAKRVFEGGDKDFKELVHKLDLTPEQESKVQGMFLDMYANSNGKPTKGEQAKVLLKSLALLTEEQKVKLREIVAQEAREAGKAKKREKSK